MATYFDKKKILEDNKDLYISDHDKTLDANSLMGIIEAKKSYESAKKAGNTAAMESANKRANSIRMSAGSYDGGTDGSEFNKSYASFSLNSKPTYKSSYDSERRKIINKISNYEDFSYDLESDPVFKIYRELYSKLGDDAYERALAKGALRTGGTQNSSAQAVAMQAKSNYNSSLMELIPELYESAYKKYSDEYEKLYKLLGVMEKEDRTQYDRYRDSLKDYESDREFFYNREKDISNLIADRYEFETNAEADRYEFDQNLAYKRERDNKDDAYRNSKLASDIYSDKVSSAINLAKAIYGKVPISRYAVESILNSLY
ncbi:MAG: hypothetical protein IJB70_02835 [Clostridia bacterium]|nr:hypothetical protein [Clostridia bacterium]